MKQTKLRAPALALERLVRSDPNAARIREGASPHLGKEIILEQVDFQDEAGIRDAFGLVAICRN